MLFDILNFVIAFSGLCISSFLLFREFANLKIDCTDEAYFSLSRNPNQDYLYPGAFIGICSTYFENKYILYLKIRLSNKSKNNINITDFNLNGIYSYNSSSSNYNNSVPISFCYEQQNGKKVIISNEKISLNNDVIKPIIKLEPYESIDGYIVFENIVQDITALNKLTLNIDTSIKKFSKTIYPSIQKFSIS